MPRRGLTLIEVMIAFAVLTVGALAALSIFPIMGRQNTSAQIRTQMLASAQEKMDELVNANLRIDTAYVTDAPTTSVPSVRKWKGSDDAYGVSALQVIEVTISWTYDRRAQSITLWGQVAP